MMTAIKSPARWSEVEVHNRKKLLIQQTKATFALDVPDKIKELKKELPSAQVTVTDEKELNELNEWLIVQLIEKCFGTKNYL